MATRIEPTMRQPREDGWATPSRVLESLYAGSPIPCPVLCGGVAEVVRVGTLASGAGELWVECKSCAQRARYDVPAATDLERRRVVNRLREANEPLCPRHALSVALVQRGRGLVCPECGVEYRRR